MHHLSANSPIGLTLTYTDSNGESFKYEGTGKINLNSFASPDLPKHQIYITDINFPDLGISKAKFRIQPQYDVIYISCSQLSDSSAQLIANIDIRLNIDQEPIVSSPINSDFIGPDIARVSKIPTTTSDLTNDSGYITSSALTDYLQTNTFKDIEWSNTTGNYKHDLTLNMSGTGGPVENGEYLLRINNYRNAGDVGPFVLVSPTFGFDASDGDRDSRLTPGNLLIDDKGDHEKTYVGAGSITLEGNIGSPAETYVLFSPYNMTVNGKVIYYSALEKLNDLPNVPTKTSELENDSGFITSSALTGYATETWVGQQGYLTSVAWGDIAGKPTFATVATSGSYNDLTNKPTVPTNYVTTDTVQTITGDKTFANIKASSFATTGTISASITSEGIKVRSTKDATNTTLTDNNLNIYGVAHEVSISATGIVVDREEDDRYTLAYRDIAKVSQIPTDNNQLANGAGYQTASDVSTAISSQTKETWTFTLADGSTVTKSVVLG